MKACEIARRNGARRSGFAAVEARLREISNTIEARGRVGAGAAIGFAGAKISVPAPRGERQEWISRG